MAGWWKKYLERTSAPAPSVPASGGNTFSKYAVLHNRKAFDSALKGAGELMARTGWTLKEYESGSMNCVTYNLKKMVEVIKIMEDKADYDGRLPIAVVSYTREDGEGHSLMRVVVQGRVPYYFEGFADPRHLKPRYLTQRELQSMRLLIS